jgi:hypothetical protein
MEKYNNDTMKREKRKKKKNKRPKLQFFGLSSIFFLVGREKKREGK